MSLLGYAMWLNKKKRHVFFLEFIMEILRNRYPYFH